MKLKATDKETGNDISDGTDRRKTPLYYNGSYNYCIHRIIDCVFLFC